MDASLVGGTAWEAGWFSCFVLQARHVRLNIEHQLPYAPLYAQRVLKHLDAPHEVKLDIVERATLALEEGDPGLGTCDDNE